MRFSIVVSMVFILVSVRNANAQKHHSTFEIEKGVTLDAVVYTFHAKDHRIDTCSTDDGTTYCLIDDRPWFGGESLQYLPKFELNSLTLKINGNDIPLDVTSMFNPNIHHAELKRTQFTLAKNVSGWELTGSFSDGIGAYMAKWVIVKGKSLRVKLSNDERDLDED